MWSAEQTREAARRRLVRQAERERELVARRAAAREHAEELARTIVEQDSNVTRIVGFGSTFDERLPFTYFSDIDLAVAGGTIIGWKMTPSSWRRELLDRMKIAVPGIRPAVITSDMVEPLDELRRFRHLFRNLYKSKLKSERVTEISASVGPLAEEFAVCHNRFTQWIEELVAAEE